MKRIVMALVLAAGLAAPAWTAQNATLVLRSGEKLGGELVDMGAGGIEFRVNGQSRKFPLAQVAVIDFVGGGTGFSSGELDQVGDGGVVTTGGQNVKGRLYDVAGSYPLKITIDLPGGGTREYNSTDLKRIYVARPSSSSASGGSSTPAQPSTPSTPGAAGAVRVAGNQRWVDTGLTVRQGETIGFSTTGELQLSSDTNDTATAAGAKSGRRPSSPMPQALAGALIGRVGAARVFGIGNQTSVPMPADGRLFLGVNDDNVDDNRGEFQVEITRTAGAASRR